MCDENIRTTLRDYVKDKNKWFYWYHDINRLEKIWIFKPEGNEEKEDEDPILKEFKKKTRGSNRRCLSWFSQFHP